MSLLALFTVGRTTCFTWTLNMNLIILVGQIYLYMFIRMDFHFIKLLFIPFHNSLFLFCPLSLLFRIRVSLHSSECLLSSCVVQVSSDWKPTLPALYPKYRAYSCATPCPVPTYILWFAQYLLIFLNHYRFNISC